MTRVVDREQARLMLQAELDGARTSEDRNRMGQFATPTALAREILAHGLNLLPRGEPIRFLDPGVGTGSFYSALTHVSGTEQIEDAVGFEVDEHYAKPARELWSDTSLDVRLGDFVRAKPTGPGANLLICNPPYVRHHHLDADRKAEIQQRTLDACGVRIGGLSGLYCYFMGLAHPFMAKGAVAGWLVPSEFMVVNYGQMLKKYLLEQVTLLQIHRYDPTDVQFDDALVSSAVVWIKNEAPPKDHSVLFTYGGTLEQPSVARSVPVAELVEERKWTRYPQAKTASRKAKVTLGGTCSILHGGLATGDNNFFIMDRAQLEERGLPMECFKPVLPGSRYIPYDEIESDEDGLPLIEKQLFLLDTRLSEDEIAERYPSLSAYLQSGKAGEKPASERYICRSRSPWYSQENRPAAPIVCTYMGRSRQGTKPFRFILNNSNATACNTFLMLYPRQQLTAASEADPTVLRRVWQFLQDIDPKELLGHGRVYGGGLHKLEPKELRGFPADALLSVLPELATS